MKGRTGELLNFCANNYLRLLSHPQVIAAAQAALEKYGVGLSSVRFICGTQNSHKELEEKIAQFHNREDAILYASCFDANTGLFEALLSSEDALFSDQLNHASIIDGIRLCKAQKYRYKNADMKDLESQLQQGKDLNSNSSSPMEPSVWMAKSHHSSRYVSWLRSTMHWCFWTSAMLLTSLVKCEEAQRSIMVCQVQWTLLTPHWARHWVGHWEATPRDPRS